jgi:phage tail-like protein
VRISNFQADADLVGRRIRVSWEFLLEGAELASIPAVTVRRKTRDFEFPTSSTGAARFLVYSSTAFPPSGTILSDLPGWEVREGDNRTVYFAESASRVVGGVAIEVLRRTTATTFDDLGNPLKRRIDILDCGDLRSGLLPDNTYYYQIFSPLVAAATDQRPYRSVATATDTHGMGRQIYESLPSIHRRHDVQTRPVIDEEIAIPEASPNAGQLRRFLDLFGVALDSMRSGADGLLEIHNIDRVDYRYLPLMARWIGWDLSFDASIPIQRHEIKYAAALYRIVGTIPGCMLWVKRLTGWESRIKEFYRNVFFTNYLGNRDDPTDHGSRTVNTAAAALMASIGQFEDDLDYTYDTGTTEQDFYAYNVVGIYVRPRRGESTATIQRKKARLVKNLSLFLPFNIRGVVILEVDTRRDRLHATVDVLRHTGEELTSSSEMVDFPIQ